MLFVLKRGMPKRAKHKEYSSFSKRESPIALYIYIYIYIYTVLFGAKHDEYSSFSKRETPIAPEYINSALRSPEAGESKCGTKNVCSSF